MERKNPKEIFLEKLLCIISEFENKTGVEMKDINFERLEDEHIGKFGIKSLIRNIELVMR
jgi:hypothetical protein